MAARHPCNTAHGWGRLAPRSVRPRRDAKPSTRETLMLAFTPFGIKEIIVYIVVVIVIVAAVIWFMSRGRAKS